MRALVTGVTGQDGSYLAELLLKKNYEVYGLIRRSSTKKLDRIEHIANRIKFIDGDLTDQTSLDEAILASKPDEVYNLAAQSFVPLSWNQPVFTSEVNSLGVVRLLEAIRKYKPDAKFLQASSSEMYGKVIETPQTELTPFYPRSPYGISKVYGHYTTVNYRESYNLFACAAISFNHESSRRGLEFVTRKVTNGVAQIVAGKSKKLIMGNLEAKRDWGFAGDYVRGMWMMLQQSKPDDYILATGKTRSIRDLLQTAFDVVDLNWRDYVQIDTKFIRPAEVDLLLGHPGKANKKLGWMPEVSFDKMIDGMVRYDIGCL